MDSKLRFLCTIGIISCLCTSIWAQTYNEKEDEYVPYSGERYDTFDWNLVKALESPDLGNAIISPFSVKVVMALLYEAATESTEKELQQVLSLPISRHATRDKFQQAMYSLTTRTGDYTFNIGSNIFLNANLQAQKRYSDILKSFYSADVTPVNFKRVPEARELINAWASNITNGHVKELVTDDSLNDDVVMILTNALYFKGMWRTPFNKNFTRPGTFYNSAKKPLTVDYMIDYGTYYYSNLRDDDVQFLRLPYKGNISMFIVLPRQADGLDKFIKNITPKVLNDLRWSLNKQDIYIYLPKFTFSYNSYLKSTLQELGLREIFENIAHLPGILDGNNGVENIKVSQVVQKAGIEVNEEGTTAWAATEATVVNKFGSQDTIFNASRPFLFFLEDENSGNVLFVGKVEDPLQTEQLYVSDKPSQGNGPLNVKPLPNKSGNRFN